MWEKFNLTTKGKELVLKSLVQSKAVFLATVNGMPKKDRKDVPLIPLARKTKRTNEMESGNSQKIRRRIGNTQHKIKNRSNRNNVGQKMVKHRRKEAKVGILNKSIAKQ